MRVVSVIEEWEVLSRTGLPAHLVRDVVTGTLFNILTCFL